MLLGLGLWTVTSLGPVAIEPAAQTEPAADAGSPAPAEPGAAGRVIVLPLRVEGTLSDSWRSELGRALDDGLADGRFEVVPAPTSSDCAEPGCLAALAEQARAQGVVRPRIHVDERDYAVVIELFDASGRVLATSEESCPVCGMAEVVAVVRAQAAALRGRLTVQALAPPTVELRSQPSGAQVRIDGVTVGTTPLRRELHAGVHRVEVTHPGYAPDVRTIEATPGIHQPIDVVLLVDDAPRRRRRVVAAAVTGVGVGAVVAGAVLWGLDSRPAPGDRCEGDNVDAAGRCRYLYDTRTVGISLTAAGVAVLATGVSLWISGRRRGRPRRAARGRIGSRLVLR